MVLLDHQWPSLVQDEVAHCILPEQGHAATDLLPARICFLARTGRRCVLAKQRGLDLGTAQSRWEEQPWRCYRAQTPSLRHGDGPATASRCSIRALDAKLTRQLLLQGVSGGSIDVNGGLRNVV